MNVYERCEDGKIEGLERLGARSEALPNQEGSRVHDEGQDFPARASPR